MAPLRIGVVAGEASGDILGAHLLTALREHCPDMIVEGIGGPLMAEQGLEPLFPMERLAVMGLVEPLKRLPELLGIRGSIYRHFCEHPPDVFLGIDAPDFNLHLEEKLRAAGVTTAHLVSPSVWAWRRGRIHKIRRAVDLMLTLFPFETAVYREHGVPVEFVGHPLADALPVEPVDPEVARSRLGISGKGPLLAILPGSRGGEVRLLGPLFLDVAARLHLQYPHMSFVVPAANEQRRHDLEGMLQAHPGLPVSVLDGQSREAMAAADAVLLASGTATLEALLLKKPMVVAYRMAPLSHAVISRLIRTPYVALPNILADAPVVPELLQTAATPEALTGAVGQLLADAGQREAQVSHFEQIHRQLRLGSAQRSAAALLQLVGRNHG